MRFKNFMTEGRKIKRGKSLLDLEAGKISPEEVEAELRNNSAHHIRVAMEYRNKSVAIDRLYKRHKPGFGETHPEIEAALKDRNDFYEANEKTFVLQHKINKMEKSKAAKARYAGYKKDAFAREHPNVKKIKESAGRKSVKGSIYILHLQPAYKHAKHYIGWTEGDVHQRLDAHQKGQGSPLLKAQIDSGGSWQLAHVIHDVTRDDERKLKNRGGASRVCPVCKGQSKFDESEDPIKKAQDDLFSTPFGAVLSAPFNRTATKKARALFGVNAEDHNYLYRQGLKTDLEAHLANLGFKFGKAGKFKSSHGDLEHQFSDYIRDDGVRARLWHTHSGHDDSVIYFHAFKESLSESLNTTEGLILDPEYTRQAAEARPDLNDVQIRFGTFGNQKVQVATFKQDGVRELHFTNFTNDIPNLETPDPGNHTRNSLKLYGAMYNMMKPHYEAGDPIRIQSQNKATHERHMGIIKNLLNRRHPDHEIEHLGDRPSIGFPDLALPTSIIRKKQLQEAKETDLIQSAKSGLKTRSVVMQRRIAKTSNDSVLLDKLVYHSDHLVRAEALFNPHTNRDTIQKISLGPDGIYQRWAKKILNGAKLVNGELIESEEEFKKAQDSMLNGSNLADRFVAASLHPEDKHLDKFAKEMGGVHVGQRIVWLNGNHEKLIRQLGYKFTSKNSDKSNKEFKHPEWGEGAQARVCQVGSWVNPNRPRELFPKPNEKGNVFFKPLTILYFK